ncbi:helix-turn-helix domain-containing protein [Luteococcus sp. Sow4_B9]|uniref:helix-turn-helix domain-containing protein n=1 Tax=Luteococcus sp. Sow4_B9 TaxID=3438792 RepID=UPI003F9DBAEE
MSAATVTPPRLLLKVEEVAEILNVGRSTAYHLVLTGEIESVTVGRLRRVPAEAVSEYVNRLRADVEQIRTGDGVA